MLYSAIEFFLISAFSVSMFGFEDNAKIAIGLYYGRKVILWLVRSKLVQA